VSSQTWAAKNEIMTKKKHICFLHQPIEVQRYNADIQITDSKNVDKIMENL
jgi:hypothetical protein